MDFGAPMEVFALADVDNYFTSSQLI